MFHHRTPLDVFRQFFEDDPGPSIILLSYRHLPVDDAQIYFVINGREGTPFEGGFYFGRVVFCIEDGLEQVFLYTPNGRFPINRDILGYFTDIRASLRAPGACSGLLRDVLYSPFEENCNCKMTEETKKKLAATSKALRDPTFHEIFPELAKQWENDGVRPASEEDMMEGHRILRKDVNCPLHDPLNDFELDLEYLGRTGVMERIQSEKKEQERIAAVSAISAAHWRFARHRHYMLQRAQQIFQSFMPAEAA
ncbi:hypothetical protein PFISCL1PPCAC_10973 [Pristionchus fissidentatus]|uniref:Uncharacterized protein n=1 Tax=Pristionchus fissidentatus TaxID=1538716 RepID=A0AAV5VJV0_9BILA|nr:hypothetical protein PFISCL1PPCAC_10973 [Pristionchus fissidentatus]